MPYKYAGYDPSTGFDCSGFVSYLFKQFNINVPRSSSALAKVGTDIPLAQTRPGDLLFYGYRKDGTFRTSHVALVYSHNNGRLAFIHSSSRGVVIDDPSSPSWDYWEKRFLFAKRVLM
jgi:cell wall-associated NlpC family hydrolase